MKKTIAIDVEVIRDWYSSLIGIYQKQIGDFEGDLSNVESKDLWEHFKFPKYVEVIKTVDENGETLENDIVETKLEQDLEGEYKVNQDYFNQFMADNVLEIFGHAKERESNIMLFLNEQQRSNKDVLDIRLFSKSGGKARPATLFFLSKYGCEISNISFIDNYSDLHSIDFKSDLIISKEFLANNQTLKQLDFKSL